MRWGTLAIFMTLLYIHASAQSEKQELKKAYLVNFHLKDGSTRSGVWISGTDSTLHFSEHGEPVVLYPEQIYKFEIRKFNSPKRNAWIGAGVGFVIGSVIGFNDSDFDSGTGRGRTGYAIGAGLIGAFAGAFVGHLIGMNGKSYYILSRTEQYRRIKPQLQKYNRPPAQ